MITARYIALSLGEFVTPAVADAWHGADQAPIPRNTIDVGLYQAIAELIQRSSSGLIHRSIQQLHLGEVTVRALIIDCARCEEGRGLDVLLGLLKLDPQDVGGWQDGSMGDNHDTLILWMNQDTLADLRQRLAQGRFVVLCRGREDRAVQSVKSTLSGVRMDINGHMGSLVRLYRKEHQLLRDIRRLSREDRATDERLGKEFDKLQNIPGILAVTLGPDDNVYAYTDEVWLEHPVTGEDIFIGSFLIQLHPADGKVRIHNNRFVHTDHHHPHISEDGSPCLGGFAEPVFSALGQYHLDVVLTILWQYLNCYNPGDAYVRLRAWDPDWHYDYDDSDPGYDDPEDDDDDDYDEDDE